MNESTDNMNEHEIILNSNNINEHDSSAIQINKIEVSICNV